MNSARSKERVKNIAPPDNCFVLLNRDWLIQVLQIAFQKRSWGEGNAKHRAEKDSWLQLAHWLVVGPSFNRCAQNDRPRSNAMDGIFYFILYTAVYYVAYQYLNILGRFFALSTTSSISGIGKNIPSKVLSITSNTRVGKSTRKTYLSINTLEYILILAQLCNGALALEVTV